MSPRSEPGGDGGDGSHLGGAPTVPTRLKLETASGRAFGLSGGRWGRWGRWGRSFPQLSYPYPYPPPTSSHPF